MNLLDLPGLAALRPVDVQQYLQNHHWQAISEPKNDVMRYRLAEASSSKEVVVEVLLDPSFADYTRRTAELVDVLSRLEQRSPLEIIDVLSMPPADILQFRICSDLVASGTIPIDDAIRFRQAQRQLLLASAHSALEPRDYYPRLSKAPAVELLSACREGQTARGSYLTRLLVPVAPALGVLPFEEPLGRKTTRLLSTALQEASRILSSGRYERLLEHAAQGLSANFLRALADLKPPGERSFLDFDIHWASSRPLPPAIQGRVRLQEGVFAALTAAAATLSERSPSLGYEIEGYVALLARTAEKADQPGQVQIATTLDDRPGTVMVRVELAPEDYRAALNAHAAAQRVKVLGTLRREGRSWILLQPTGFEVLPSIEGES